MGGPGGPTFMRLSSFTVWLEETTTCLTQSLAVRCTLDCSPEHLVPLMTGLLLSTMVSNHYSTAHASSERALRTRTSLQAER